VVECVFEDFKGGKYKIISFHAKRARGLMARWAIAQGLVRPSCAVRRRRLCLWPAGRSPTAGVPPYRLLT
jgi:hypothetical protein